MVEYKVIYTKSDSGSTAYSTRFVTEDLEEALNLAAGDGWKVNGITEFYVLLEKKSKLDK